MWLLIVTVLAVDLAELLRAMKNASFLFLALFILVLLCNLLIEIHPAVALSFFVFCTLTFIFYCVQS